MFGENKARNATAQLEAVMAAGSEERDAADQASRERWYKEEIVAIEAPLITNGRNLYRDWRLN